MVLLAWWIGFSVVAAMVSIVTFDESPLAAFIAYQIAFAVIFTAYGVL